MNIRLTNGKKTITRAKDQYEANIKHFKMRGFVPVGEVKKEIKKATSNQREKKMLRKLRKKIKKFINWFVGKYYG